MIYISKTTENNYLSKQKELISEGYEILDVLVVHNGLHHSYGYFIKYRKPK